MSLTAAIGWNKIVFHPTFVCVCKQGRKNHTLSLFVIKRREVLTLFIKQPAHKLVPEKYTGGLDKFSIKNRQFFCLFFDLPRVFSKLNPQNMCPLFFYLLFVRSKIIKSFGINKLVGIIFLLPVEASKYCMHSEGRIKKLARKSDQG